MALLSGGSSIPIMANEPTPPVRKPGAELTPFVALGLTVLLATFGQVAWLDGKIERLDAKLSGEIQRVEDRLNIGLQNHQDGLAEVRERLVAVESGLAAAALESRVTAPGRRAPS